MAPAAVHRSGFGSSLAAAVDLVTARVHNAFGEVIAETDARGHTTGFTYNAMGRLIRTLRAEVSVTAENGAVSTVRPEELNYYDIAGRLIATRDANGNITRRLLVAGTGHGGAEALVAKQWNADGGMRQQGHDVHGDLRRVTDEIGRVSEMTYDAMGRLITQTRAAGTALELR